MQISCRSRARLLKEPRQQAPQAPRPPGARGDSQSPRLRAPFPPQDTGLFTRHPSTALSHAGLSGLLGLRAGTLDLGLEPCHSSQLSPPSPEGRALCWDHGPTEPPVAPAAAAPRGTGTLTSRDPTLPSSRWPPSDLPSSVPIPVSFTEAVGFLPAPRTSPRDGSTFAALRTRGAILPTPSRNRQEVCRAVLPPRRSANIQVIMRRAILETRAADDHLALACAGQPGRLSFP